MNEKPTWILCYRGESEYSWRGKKYRVRSHACPGPGKTETSADGHYNGNYYFVGILPAVGTVRNDYSEGFHDFPPQELADFFPGYVRAKWSEDFAELLYDGDKPATVTDACGYVTTKAIADART